jgi:sugar phosphate isomerase/epimerase
VKLSIQQTLLPEGNLSERFERAREYGFSGVELAAWGFPGAIPDFLSEIEMAMQTSGLVVSSLCTARQDDFVHPEPRERERRLDGLVEMLQFADTIGARGVIALPIRLPLHFPDLSPLANERSLITQMSALTLKAAVAQTSNTGAAIFLEPLNRYEAAYLRTVSQAAELCRAVNEPRVKIVADTFHMNIEEADIAISLVSEAEYIGHVHLADSNRLLPGHGHISFVEPFRTLREIDFDGWLTLECAVPGEPDETLPSAVQFLKHCWRQAASEER